MASGMQRGQKTFAETPGRKTSINRQSSLDLGEQDHAVTGQVDAGKWTGVRQAGPFIPRDVGQADEGWGSKKKKGGVGRT